MPRVDRQAAPRDVASRARCACILALSRASELARRQADAELVLAFAPGQCPAAIAGATATLEQREVAARQTLRPRTGLERRTDRKCVRPRARWTLAGAGCRAVAARPALGLGGTARI